MHLRTTPVVASLALLSSAAYSSPPLAFTASRNSNNSNGPISTRVRKRVLARTFLNALPPTSDLSSSEFTRRRTRMSRTSSTSTATNTERAGGVSTGIVDSQKEYELNLGRAVDTLKKDYPDLLYHHPSWNLYHDDLEVIDPSGVSLHGLENYKMAFGFIHAVVKVFYCEEKSSVTSVRVAYDCARKCIRVSWNVELVPRMIYGGTRNILHVDGISEYYLNQKTGLITEHKVSHLLINDQTVKPANGIFNALAEMSPGTEGSGVPVFFQPETEALKWEDMNSVKFQTWNPLNRQQQTSLFNNPNEQTMNLPETSINTDSPVPYDTDALQRKNVSRKKFGMPPLTPEEFIAIEEEVRAMDATNKKKAAYLAEQLAQTTKPQKEESFLSKLFGGALKNGCESNFDCERPEVCCDVGFKKICCSNGLGIVDGMPVANMERALLRMPIPNDNVDY